MRKSYVILVVCLISFGIFGGLTFLVNAQSKLSISKILSVFEDKSGRQTMSQKNQLLIEGVKKSGVSFTLTADRESDLRDAGANDELINVIRRNSPPVKAVPTPTPITVIKEVFVTPTPTPRPRITDLPNTLTFNLADSSATMEFVKIPAGSFIMGSGDAERKEALRVFKQDISSVTLDIFNDEKQHQVTIGRDFYLGKYEVTQAQWKAVMGKDNNPSVFITEGNMMPVETVTWDEAKEFIGKLSHDVYEFSLPSEAEWEYACRAGTTAAFSFGDSLHQAKLILMVNIRSEMAQKESI